MRDIVAEACAAAAAGDEDEGLEGAAARAAARAAALGVAAASSGYSSLGGVDEHVWPCILMLCSCPHPVRVDILLNILLELTSFTMNCIFKDVLQLHPTLHKSV